MTNEERAARATERAAAKAGKRAANKEAWKHHPANANAAWMQKQAELKAAAEIKVDPVDVPDTGSLAKMRAIMADTGAPLYRRLDAAEVILTYELAPGSAVGVPSEQIAATSYRFLRAVAEAAETPEALKFRALKAVVAVENARKAAIQSPAQITAKRELLVEVVNGVRRAALIEAGRWPLPPGEGYGLSVSDSFEWPEGWPGSWQWPPTDIGARFDRALRKHEAELKANQDAFRAKLLAAVKAKNRPDDWERLLQSRAA